MQRRQQLKFKILIGMAVVAGAIGSAAFVGAPRDTTRSAVGNDTTKSTVTDPQLHLTARLSERVLIIEDGDSVVRQYPVAVGQAKYPTPRGSYLIRRIVWNPRWTPPPDAKWAKNQTAKDPGHPDNPMKLVKIFIKEPDYYIHGTDDIESLGTAASHGCLRMDPYDAADVAKYLMDHGGQPREESWFWRIIHFGREEKEIYLKQPIPITITD
jgi:lipoprotein-anchoring transpeptidase ErfK/SrfK